MDFLQIDKPFKVAYEDPQLRPVAAEAVTRAATWSMVANTSSIMFMVLYNIISCKYYKGWPRLGIVSILSQLCQECCLPIIY